MLEPRGKGFVEGFAIGGVFAMVVTLAAAGMEFWRFYNPTPIDGVTCIRIVYRGGENAEGFQRHLWEGIPCPPYAATRIIHDPGPCASDCESRPTRLEPPEHW